MSQWVTPDFLCSTLDMMTALQNKLRHGHYQATEEEGDQETPKEIWSQKWEQQDSSTAGGGRWRWWLKKEKQQGISK